MSMDAARFQVSHTFPLPSRTLFFVLGDVLHGEVRTGMVVDAGPGFRSAIHTVEMADSPSERRAYVALGFRYTSAAELDGWQGVPWEGVTLEIPAEPILHPCPCCGFRTMPDEERGSFDICPVCGWEDDRLQYADPDYRGGANEISLNQARAQFAARHDPSSF
ncbi:CPCC family cysteine-rich protein [Longimicrobium sp.]|uniref:CPCC family cysteine-rich protein n=1 Tax=Longimicrobium sp. TaxID=2029185 RepID=UPI003B3BA66B